MRRATVNSTESPYADDILPMDVLNHVNIYETLRGGDITISLKECFANIVESELDNYNMPYQYQRSTTQPTQSVFEVDNRLMYVNKLIDAALEMV